MLHAKLLRYLDEVARCGSIRKASLELNVASSAINRQILALEAKLGAPIFERLPRKLRLTVTGEVLIGHVRQTLKDYDRMQEQLARLRGVESGRVALTATSGLIGGPLAPFLARFCENHPRVRLDVQTALADAIPDAVRDGTADLGLCFNLRSGHGLRSLAKFELPLGVVVAKEHELAGKAPQRMAEIAYFPLVVAEKGMNLRAMIDTALVRANVRPNIVAETNSPELMKQMARWCEGVVTFLNPLDITAERMSGELSFVPFVEPWFRPQELVLITRDPVSLGPLGHRFADQIASALHEMMASVS